MRKFTKDLTYFCSCLFIYFVVMYGVNLWIFNYQSEPIDATTLVIGDSKSMMSLDTTSFDNCKNVAQEAEPIYVSFWKLKYFCKNSESIQTVLMSIGPHSLSGLRDYRLQRKHMIRDELFDRIGFIGNYQTISKQIPIAYIPLMVATIRNSCLYPTTNSFRFMGEYRSRDVNIIDDGSNWVEHYFYHEGKIAGLSETSVHYLDSIHDYCTKRGIDFHLIMEPIHSSFESVIPQKFLTFYYSSMETLKNNGVKLIDLTNAEIPDSMFANTNHLNKYGSQWLSDTVSDRIE